MLILYKNDRNVRFVLFTKTSNITSTEQAVSVQKFSKNEMAEMYLPVCMCKILNKLNFCFSE